MDNTFLERTEIPPLLSKRYRMVVEALATISLVLLLGPGPAAGQASGPARTPAATGKRWTLPRTSDGHPDLQGVWTNNSVTPLERPSQLAGKEFYTDAELAAIQKADRDRFNTNEVKGLPPANHSGVEGAAADTVHYDFAQFGLDREQAKVAWSRRTSMIIGPDGKIPPLTPEARQRIAERAATERGHENDGPENTPLTSRCIARPNAGPPMIGETYNSNLQIVQGPGYVAIETEMIHDARIIPTDGRPHLPPNIRQWMGDPRGHWEGDTLVIDSTNFTDLNPFPGAENLHVIERLTRVDADTIRYEFTAEDPGMWTKPWSGELLITRISGELYEYACNEGNYGLENILRGARIAEAAQKSEK